MNRPEALRIRALLIVIGLAAALSLLMTDAVVAQLPEVLAERIQALDSRVRTIEEMSPQKRITVVEEKVDHVAQRLDGLENKLWALILIVIPVGLNAIAALLSAAGRMLAGRLKPAGD